jgi:predicted acetyltransferase
MNSSGLTAAQAATSVGSLRLRPLQPTDEAPFRAAHTAMAPEGFVFGLGLEPDMPWPAYLRMLEDHRAGVNLPAGYVPATFLVAEVAGQLVGRTSIRHRLNEFLTREGGHIGYGVVPGHRRRGYGTEILRQSLVIARAVGIGPVLVTCDDDNLGSIRIIEACGGHLESTATSAVDGRLVRRYWIQ